MYVCTSCFTKGHKKLNHIAEKRHCSVCAEFTWCYHGDRKEVVKPIQTTPVAETERGLYIWLREPHATQQHNQ